MTQRVFRALGLGVAALIIGFLVLFGLTWLGARQLPFDQLLALAVEQYASALAIGAIYALIALGYTMVYGIIELINFAHGDVFMVGAFVAYLTFTTLGINGAISNPIFLVLALLVAFAVSMVLLGLLA